MSIYTGYGSSDRLPWKCLRGMPLILKDVTEGLWVLTWDFVTGYVASLTRWLLICSCESLPQAAPAVDLDAARHTAQQLGLMPGARQPADGGPLGAAIRAAAGGDPKPAPASPRSTLDGPALTSLAVQLQVVRFGRSFKVPCRSSHLGMFAETWVLLLPATHLSEKISSVPLMIVVFLKCRRGSASCWQARGRNTRMRSMRPGPTSGA